MQRAAAVGRALTWERSIPCRSFHRGNAQWTRIGAAARPAAEEAGDKDDHFMRLALQHARVAAASGEVPVGAVLVSADGTVLAEASNSVKRSGDPTAHAEMLCIRQASVSQGGWQNLATSTLYVTLEPCAMCAGAVLQTRLAALVWGAANPLLGADGSWVSILRPPSDPAGGDEQPSTSSSSSSEAPRRGGATATATSRCSCCGLPRFRPHPFQPALAVRRVPSLEAECGEVMKAFFARRREESKANKERRGAAAARQGAEASLMDTAADEEEKEEAAADRRSRDGGIESDSRNQHS